MPPRSSIILGISFGHGDSSAALVVDGHLVAAAEEERFTRTKHYALFPTEAAKYCLQHAGLKPSDVTILAIPKQQWKHAGRRFQAYWKHPQLFSTAGKRRETAPKLSNWLKEMGLARARMFSCEHHLAHLATARCLKPEEPMALLSLDGMGDFTSATMAVADEQKTQVLDRIFFPHSLGYFYTGMTQYLGFPHYGDEFKVMGLSSYGTPRYLPVLRELIRETDGFGFELNLEAFPILRNPIQFRIEKGQPYIDPFFSTGFLTQCLGIGPRNPKRQPIEQVHRDLAKSIQCRFEEVADHLLHALYAKTGMKSLGLSGGCAHNSVWVGKIPKRTPFQNIYVAPACHDAGLAAGAAILAARSIVSVEGGHWGLLGPTIEEMGQPADPKKKKHFSDEASLVRWAAERLSQGEIIGLAHGRLEFGPRALGSRSILADPRYPGMRDRLNERVKHRETFRPFAASVLAEYQNDWFFNSFHSPHMEAVFEVKPAVRDQIPAVVHADNTCRIQSVEKETQSFYWNLIEAFRQLTGIPMLINTSFNDSEPIVASEKDAMACFLKSDLDHLIVDQTVYSKAELTEASTTKDLDASQSVTA